jgi:hypothetical protein
MRPAKLQKNLQLNDNNTFWWCDMQKQNSESVYELIEESIEARQHGESLRSAELLLRSFQLVESDLDRKAELKAKLFHLLANSYCDLRKLDLASDFYGKAWMLAKANQLQLDLSFYEDTYIQSLRQTHWKLGIEIQKDLRCRFRQRAFLPANLRLKNLLRLTALHWLNGNYYEAERSLKEYVEQMIEESSSARDKLAVLGLFALHLNKLNEAKEIYEEILSDSNISNDDKTEVLRQLGYLLCMEGNSDEGQLRCRQANLLNGDFHVESELSEQFRAIAQVYCQKKCSSEAMKFCQAGIESFEVGHLGKADQQSMKLIFKRLGLTEDLSLLPLPA